MRERERIYDEKKKKTSIEDGEKKTGYGQKKGKKEIKGIEVGEGRDN